MNPLLHVPGLMLFLLLTLLPPSGGAPAEEGNPPPAGTRGVRVAVCQVFCLDGDRSGNLARVERALAEARNKGAEIACFPETALLGWVNPAAHERARTIPGKDTEALAALARLYRLWICCGLAEKAGEKLYDAAVLIDPSGRIVLHHRKINVLAELMDPPYTPGTAVRVADTPLGRIGLLVCADTFKKEILERMAKLSPDLLLVAYGWAAPEKDWPGHGKVLERTVCAAARAAGAAVAGTDGVGEITNGPWRGYVYGGQSVVADQDGKVLARCADRDREVRVVVVPLPVNPDSRQH